MTPDFPPPGIPLPPVARATEFRADGWPLCPICGDDELYSLALPTPTVATICGCYRCGPLTLDNTQQGDQP